MKILMSRPTYYGIKYEINPWMNVTHGADQHEASQQWENLHQTILSIGAETLLVSPVSGWPDMVFTANAGLIYQNKVILSHFKFKERQGEVPYFETWFKEKGFEIIPTEKKYYFEGAGDALYAGDLLFVGYGFRSDREFYETTPFFDQEKLIYCELVNPYFYHLDTCFCPLNDNLALWYPFAFSETSQKSIREKINVLTVTEEEAKRFACNAVVLGKHVIVPEDCPIITRELQNQGFTVHACHMGEFLKAGGACKCLTLRLT